MDFSSHLTIHEGLLTRKIGNNDHGNLARESFDTTARNDGTFND